MKSFSALLLLAVFCLAATAEKSTGSSKWLRSIIPDDYVKELFPKEKVETQLSMYFLQFHDYDENTKQLTADLYLRFHWRDPRLVSSNTSPDSELVKSPSLKDNIWIPDIFIVNAINYQLAGGPNSFVKINQTNGNVTFSQKIQVRFPCKIMSSNIQCDLKFESYGHTADELSLSWKKKPAYSSNVNDDRLTLEDVTNEQNTITLTSSKKNYDRLTVSFKFAKDINEVVNNILLKNALKKKINNLLA